MKIEEVIKQLESILDHTRSMAAEADADGIWKKDIAALEFAITALRSMSEAGKDTNGPINITPLSLKQLKQMDGKPVWVVCLKKEKYIDPPIGWRILEKSISGSFGVWNGENCLSQRSYSSDWLAYSYPPAHIDRSKWEACDNCKKACWNCKHNLFCCEGNDKECDDCVNQSKWEWGGYQRYCSKCGRPLTEEAWAELERRLRMPEPPKEE